MQNVSNYVNNTAPTTSTAILDSVLWITALPIHGYENLLSGSNIPLLTGYFLIDGGAAVNRRWCFDNEAIDCVICNTWRKRLRTPALDHRRVRIGFVGNKLAPNRLIISEYLCFEDAGLLKSYTWLTGK